MIPGDWLTLALCLGEDPEAFFPTKNGPAPKSVRAVCYRCDVRTQCLQHALTLEAGEPRHHRHGIWAATTPHERWRLDRARQLVSA